MEFKRNLDDIHDHAILPEITNGIISKTPAALNKAFDQVTLSQLGPVSLGRPFGMFLPDMEALTSGLAPVCVWRGWVGVVTRGSCIFLVIPLEHLLCGFYVPLARI